MKKLLLLSLLCASSAFGYTELENKLFDAINNRDEKWAKELVAKLEPLSKDLKEAVTNVAEKNLKKYYKATTNIDHSYGDQLINYFGTVDIALGILAFGIAGSAKIGPEAATSSASSRLAILATLLIGTGIYAKFKAYYCAWAYKNLKEAQSVVGVIADAKVKEDEKHN